MNLFIKISKEDIANYRKEFLECLMHNSSNSYIKEIFIYTDEIDHKIEGISNIKVYYKRNLPVDSQIINYSKSFRENKIIFSNPFVKFNEDLYKITDGELDQFVITGNGYYIYSININLLNTTELVFTKKEKSLQLKTSTIKILKTEKLSNNPNVLVKKSVYRPPQILPTKRDKKLDVVIVSVNYNDYLVLTLKENKKIFSNITVVTSSTDTRCQEICRRYKVNCVVTDVMYEDGSIFNKGKAINVGLSSLENPDLILLLDADIIVETPIDLDRLSDEILYTSERIILLNYNSYKQYIENGQNKRTKLENDKGYGFFQLFCINNSFIDKNKPFPENSIDASYSDLEFRDKFNHRQTIGNPCLHLGEPFRNWKGRLTEKFILESEFDSIFNKKSTFTICSYYFNYRGDLRQKNNFIKFLEQWKDHYENMIVGVVDYGDIDFEIPCKSLIIKGDLDNKIWSKEILINKIIDEVDTDYFIWIDGDLIYDNLDWINDIDEVVKNNDFVQLFESINYLGESGEILETHKSILSAESTDMDNLLGKGYKPGGAWLGRTSILKKHKLFDKMYVGGGDTIFTYGLFNIDSGYTLNLVKETNIEIYEGAINWINEFSEYKFNYLKEDVNHLYHGDLSERNYNGRYVNLNNQNKRVMIIIPAFNSEKTILKSLESVLNQTYRNIKIVVVLDGCSDNTEDLVNSVIDNRIFILKNNKNLGTYSSINRALHLFQSEFDFFTIHGSDDVMNRKKITLQLNCFENDRLAVSAGFRRINYNTGEQLSQKNFGESMIIYKKEVFDEIGYYDYTRFGADTEYYERFLTKYGTSKIKNMEDILSDCFYVDDKNLTLTIPNETRIEYIHKFRRIHKNNSSLYKGYVFSGNSEIKVVMLSVSDYAGSGEEIKKSIISVSNNVEVITVRTKPHKYGYKSDYVINQNNIEYIQNLIDVCDIVHFKGDELPNRDWHGLKIPDSKKIVITVGGSGFRRGTDKLVCNQWFPIESYKNLSDLRTTITPDLNYPEFNSVYTPHALDVDSIPYTWSLKNNFIIQHSPSSRAKKGTDDIILPALNELINEGFKFDIQLIENLTNDECVEMKKNGTIFIDQISSTGFYGRSAIESMQYGVPTIAYISDEAKKQSVGLVGDSSAVMSVSNKEELKNRIRELLNNKRLLKEVSLKTKKYVSDLHSYYFVGTLWVNLYRSLINKPKKILLSQYRPAIRLFKWANTLKKYGYEVDILSTGDAVENIDFSNFKMKRYESDFDYKSEYDLHISFNTNIKTISHLNIKTIQAVGDIKSYYEKDKKNEQISMEKAHKVIFVSDNQMKEAISFYPSISDKSSVIVNGIIEELKQKKNLPKLENGFINLVYSGTISDLETNHRYFFNFFKKMNDSDEIKLHIYPSAVGLSEIYKSLKNVIIHETVNPEVLIEELSQYDCALLYLEGHERIANSMLPNKIFEYLQAGLPVLSGKYEEIIKLDDNSGSILFFEDEIDLLEKVKKYSIVDKKLLKSKVITYEDQLRKIFEIIES